MMSSAIFVANFPTLVPPNFCTSHLASGSIVFWCMFGGVVGRLEEAIDDEREEDEELGGLDMMGLGGRVLQACSLDSDSGPVQNIDSTLLNPPKGA